MSEETEAARVLLLDTCAETGSVALSVGNRIVAEVLLPERGASTAVLGTVAAMLAEAGLRVADLMGVGVVNGPGSFTGVRVGLAVAKGLCEAANVPAAAVSRLAVLADKSGLTEGYAVLRAGRDQLFVREIREGKGRESLVEAQGLLQSVDGAPLVYAEESQGPMLMEAGEARLVALSARDALGLVRARLREGGDDLAALDANYVRDEDAIYARQRAKP